ncbi:MAG: hypothetical protein Q9191_003422 [Dirinaria sp. TL-2023a]
MSSALRQKFPEDRLHILVATHNSGNFTYDGIETGAERVTQEIEEHIASLEKEGSRIARLSMFGYSLGGLLARYSIGLMYSNGWFDRIEPVNFTTSATPHLGVRTPILGVHSRLWNVLGSRTLSTSGRQLFSIDTFRDTGRPLLSVLSDPHSIFMKALSLFKHRVLYANIINDRSAPYYTSYITKVDPYTDLSAIDIHYIKGYDPIVADPIDPVSRKPPDPSQTFWSRIAGNSQNILTHVPIMAAFVVLIPIGSVLFLVNSGIQSIRSQKRIKLHESGQAGVGLGNYRIPLMVENARSAVEGTISSMNGAQQRKTLPAGVDKDPNPQSYSASEKLEGNVEVESVSRRRSSSIEPRFPVLNLSSEQFTMVDNLDEIGWRKYAVHIPKVRHTHAAIIVRSMSRKSFKDGKRVVDHWLEEEFEI